MAFQNQSKFSYLFVIGMFTTLSITCFLLSEKGVVDNNTDNGLCSFPSPSSNPNIYLNFLQDFERMGANCQGNGILANPFP